MTVPKQKIMVEDASIRVPVRTPKFDVLNEAFLSRIRLPTDERIELYVVGRKIVWGSLVPVAEFEIRGTVEIDLAELVGID